MAGRRNFIRRRNPDKLRVSRSKYEPHQSIRECARRVSRDITTMEDPGAKPFLDRFGSIGYAELKLWLDRRNSNARKTQG